MQLALQGALSNSLSTLAVVVHEHLPKPLSTHYNGNFDDEPEFRSLEPASVLGVVGMCLVI